MGKKRTLWFDCGLMRYASCIERGRFRGKDGAQMAKESPYDILEKSY
jgi:hypothetical protein